MESISQHVSAGASERELRAELKKYLSILGKSCAYSSIKDEYIVFSEFPIGHGNVDFVVFTGRSRMEVILIEIKGANFNFVNNNDSIAVDINLAAQQIRERFYVIKSNYEPFRRDVHAIRSSVENGAQKYNSFLGPTGYLRVDPNKDIDVSGVVIGGRTKEDIQESRIRHQLELNSPKIQFESWDSWLRKYAESN
ncbi:hypothetical protein BMS3Abin16_01800 [archaeon BMS3Abin16]|nr:hypothetical protein BMS3Abin16_01800 [archaeon BMS3Abin16]HDY74030.1 DUF4263 domain-containing protein [Euryarchaeota archaeon]